MINLVLAEWLKLRKRLIIKILPLVLIFFLFMTFFGMYTLLANPPKDIPPQFKAQIEKTTANARNQLTLPGSIAFSLQTIGGIGMFLVVILGASSIGSEYSWGTLRTILVREPRRRRFLLAKFIALAIMVAIGIVIGLIGGILLSFIFTGMLGKEINLGFLSLSFLWDFLRMFAKTSLVLLSWLLFAYCITILTGSTIAGITVGLVYSFIEGLITGVPAVAEALNKITPYLLGYNSNVLLAISKEMVVGWSFGGEKPKLEIPSPLHATIVLLVYCAIFLLVSLFAFKRKDITV